MRATAGDIAAPMSRIRHLRRSRAAQARWPSAAGAAQLLDTCARTSGPPRPCASRRASAAGRRDGTSRPAAMQLAEAMHLAAQPAEGRIGGEQVLRGDAAHGQHDASGAAARSAAEVGQAGRHFLGLRVAIAGRPALEHVGDEHLLARSARWPRSMALSSWPARPTKGSPCGPPPRRAPRRSPASRACDRRRRTRPACASDAARTWCSRRPRLRSASQRASRRAARATVRPVAGGCARAQPALRRRLAAGGLRAARSTHTSMPSASQILLARARSMRHAAPGAGRCRAAGAAGAGQPTAPGPTAHRCRTSPAASSADRSRSARRPAAPAACRRSGCACRGRTS